jgi:hypothetical protein
MFFNDVTAKEFALIDIFLVRTELIFINVPRQGRRMVRK